MHKKTVRRIVSAVLWPCAAVAAILGVWWIAAAAMDTQLLLPTPAAALAELWRCLGDYVFWRAYAFSVLRALFAFGLAVVLSAVTAAFSFVCRPLRLFLGTVVAVLRALPTMSIILLLIVWVGGSLTPILVSVLVLYPVLYAAAVGGCEDIDPQLLETARLYALGRGQRVVKIYAPLALPAYLTSAAGAASLSLKLVIAAEVLAQTRRSIGQMMQLSQIYFETGRLLALTVAVIAAAALLEGTVLLLRKLTVRRLFG